MISLFDWSEYLDLAGFLRNGCPDDLREACYRSAISRSYYAAYNTAKTFARDNEGFQPVKSGVDHRLVRKHFESNPQSEKRDIAIQLRRLNVWRNKCDYDDVIDDLPKILQLSLRRAEGVITLILKMTESQH